MAGKLKDIGEKLRQRRHESNEIRGKWLISVVRGYFQYHAVPDNERRLKAFRKDVLRRWLRQLRRRSQRSRWTWKGFLERLGALLPPGEILQSWPHERIGRRHAREEPCA